MVTERFRKLPGGKKELIREAAVKEFIRVPFEKASINKIIKAAGISRGSFYTYFEDTYDVLEYLFEDAAQGFQNIWISRAEKHNGDLWDIMEDFLHFSIANITGDFPQLIKNIVDSGSIFSIIHRFFQNNNQKLFFLQEVLYDSIDKADFKDQSIDTFEKLISMIFLELAHCIGWYCHCPWDEEKIKEAFLKELEILQYGIRKH